MLNVLSVTTPIFLLITLGFLTVRRGVLKPTEMPTLGRLVTSVLLPALIFASLAPRKLDEIILPAYLLVYALASLLVFFGILLFSLKVRKRDLTTSTLNAMASSCSNSGYIGFPLAMALLAPVAPLALAMCMIVENLIILPLGLILSEWSQQKGRPVLESVGRTFKLLAKSPISLSLAAGLLCSVLEVPLPEPLFKAVQMTAAASGAIALFTIGGILSGLSLSGMKGTIGDIAVPTIGKLVLHPMVVLMLLMLLPPFDPALQVAAVAMACSPMMSIYPILAAKFGYDGTAAATLLIATASSFFTISLAFWLFGASDFIHLGGTMLPHLFERAALP
ncbi:MAG: AEC family transporter [Oceanobacter sp.]